jgi:hypothetical protein
MLLVMTGCEVKVAPVLPQAKADYAEALEETGIPALTAFYEIEMQLDKPVSAINKGEDVQLLKALTVIAAGNKKVKFIDRTYDKKGNVVDANVDYGTGNWLGDCPMNLDSLVLDLPDAIERLKETNQVLPTGDKVTLRQPLSPPFRALYIFGTVGTFFVSVDAITGEVKLLEEETALSALKDEEEEAEEAASEE